MANTIRLKSGSGNNPSASDLVVGEVALRTDGNPKLFTKNDAGNVLEVGLVESGSIVAGSIVNADINASAAIAGTKISPDFGSQNVSSTGYFSFGTAGGTDNFSKSNLRIENTYPTLFLNDTDTNNDFYIRNADGVFNIHDVQANVNRFTLNSSGTAAFSGNLDVGAGIDVTGEITVTSHIDIPDNAKIKLGNSDDLEIYHDSNNSYVQDTGTGNLVLKGTQVVIQSGGSNKSKAIFRDNGASELYHGISSSESSAQLKIATTTTGVSVTGNIAVSGTVDGVDVATRDTLFGGLTSSSGVLTNGVTATTQSAGDNSTKVATTAYTDTAISNLVDSSPSTLNTLNELAAALGDDANFSTTVTNSIATKLPLAGGTLTGNLELSSTYPSLTFTDTNHNSDYRITNNDGQLIIYDITNGAHRLNVNADGHVDILGNLDVGAGLDVAGNIDITDGTLIIDNDADSPNTSYGLAEALRIDDSGGTNDRALNIYEYHQSGSRFFSLNYNLESGSTGSAYTYTQGNYAGSSMLRFDNTFKFFVDSQVTSGSTDVITPTERFEIDTSGINVTGNISCSGTATFSGNLTISNTQPIINLTDTNANSDFQIKVDGGHFDIKDVTNGVGRFNIQSDGTTTISGNLNASSGLDVTGDVTITKNIPVLKLIDSDNNDDFALVNRNGLFVIRDDTDGADRFTIASNGRATLLNDAGVNGNLDVGNGLDVTGQIAVAKAVNDTDFTNDNLPGATSGLYVANTQQANGVWSALTAMAYNDITNNQSASFIVKSVDGSTTTPEVYITQRSVNTQRIAIKIPTDGSVDLNYAGSTRLSTSSDGATITGRLSPAANNTYGLGTSSLRFANFFSVTGNFSGTLTATTFSGSGASLTNIPAGQLTGTLPALDGSNLTGLTVNNANTLDNLDSTQFLRSDTNTLLNGILTVGGSSVSGNEGGEIRFTHSPNSSLSGNEIIVDVVNTNLRFFEGGGNTRGFYLDLSTASNSAAGKIFHTGNDGSGSGLDADTLDGVQASGLVAVGGDTMTGALRIDKSSTVDGILGEAFSTYFGLKHSDQSYGSEYMILSKDDDTFISCSANSAVRIRPNANNSAHELLVTSNVTLAKAAFGAGNVSIDPDSYSDYTGGFGSIGDGSGWGARGMWVHGGGTGDAAAIAHNGAALYFGIQNGSSANSMETWLQVTPNTRVVNFSTDNNATNVQIGGNKIFHAGNDGSGSGLDADTLDGVQGSSYLRSDSSDTMSANLTITGRLDVGDGSGNDMEIRIFKADNNVSDHIQFYNGSTRVGEIGVEDNSWLRINQESGANIYTPRMIRADDGFQVDGTTVIDGSANVIGARVSGTVANATRAENLAGYSQSDSASTNTIVRRNSNGYIFANYFNTTSNDTGTGTDVTRFYASEDSYIRYLDKASMRAVMNTSARSSAYAGRENNTSNQDYWLGTAGWGNQNFDTTVWDFGSCFFDTWADPSGEPSGTSHWNGFQAMHYTNASSRYGMRITMGAGQTALAYIQGRWNQTTYGWHKLWNEGNDGSGSGLDADKLDGVEGSNYLRSDTGDAMNGNLTLKGELSIENTVSGINGAYSEFITFKTTQTNGQSATTGRIVAQGQSAWGGDLILYTKPANSTPNNSVSERVRVTAEGTTKFILNGTPSDDSTCNIILGRHNTGNEGGQMGFARANDNHTLWMFDCYGNNNQPKLRMHRDGAEMFSFNYNGNFYRAGSTLSDRDLKENIQDLTGTSLDQIIQLSPKTFNFKESENYLAVPKTGFIAQEVASVMPSLVNGTDGEKDMGVDFDGIVAHLVNSVKELKALNDSLKARIEALESK